MSALAGRDGPRSSAWGWSAGGATGRHEWTATLGRAARTTRGKVGLGLLGFVVLVAAIGPAVAPHPPNALLATPFAPPSGAFPLGADALGRDVLSRTLAGGWLLLLMAAAATALGVAVGAAVGMTAAYIRGPADGLLMRTIDVILAFPQLLFALLLVSIVGPKLWLIVIAVALTHAPPVARVVRAAALDVSERDFVKIVELQGVSPRRIMVSEILPNLVSPLMVETGLRMTYSIIVIAGLAFLGFGQPPPTANWGLMINENRAGIEANPWAVLAPVTLIALLTIGMNTFTDAIARVTLGVDRRAVMSRLPDADPRVTDLAPPP
jgi:peptide/nickel transport system permease protein